MRIQPSSKPRQATSGSEVYCLPLPGESPPIVHQSKGNMFKINEHKYNLWDEEVQQKSTVRSMHLTYCSIFWKRKGEFNSKQIRFELRDERPLQLPELAMTASCILCFKRPNILWSCFKIHQKTTLKTNAAWLCMLSLHKTTLNVLYPLLQTIATISVGQKQKTKLQICLFFSLFFHTLHILKWAKLSIRVHWEESVCKLNQKKHWRR